MTTKEKEFEDAWQIIYVLAMNQLDEGERYDRAFEWLERNKAYKPQRNKKDKMKIIQWVKWCKEEFGINTEMTGFKWEATYKKHWFEAQTEIELMRQIAEKTSVPSYYEYTQNNKDES